MLCQSYIPEGKQVDSDDVTHLELPHLILNCLQIQLHVFIFDTLSVKYYFGVSDDR